MADLRPDPLVTAATATKKLALKGAGVDRRWLIVLPVVAIIVLYWPSFFWLAQHWLDGGTYGHGPLLALLCGYFFWFALKRPVDVAKPYWPGALALVVISFGWLLAREANVQLGQQILLPFLALAALSAAFGLETARRLSFPILLLYLAIPVWDLINYPLQIVTAKMMGGLFGILGRPVTIEGTYVSVSAGVFRIADGCSGLRFMLVGSILALSYGYTEFSRWKSRWLLVGAALALATLTNWIRVGLIIYLGDVTDMAHPWVEDHVNIGWFMFAAAALLMIPVASHLHRRESGLAIPERQALENAGSEPVSTVALVVTLILLSLAPVFSLLPKTVVIDTRNAVALAAAPAGWHRELSPGAAVLWRPVFSAPDAESFGQYESLGAIIHSYHVFYATQDQQRELIGQGSAIEGGLTIIKRQRVTVGDKPFMRLDAQAGSNRRWLVYYTYRVGTQAQSSARLAKLGEALQGLRRQSGSGLSAYAIACRTPRCDWAESTLIRFLDQIPLPTVARVTD